MTASLANVDLVHRLKAHGPDVFHSMVKMHLSFLLDLNTDDCDCSFVLDPAHSHAHKEGPASSLRKKIFTPRKSSSSSSSHKGVMDGITLTMEGVCQVFQLIEFLARDHNIVTEGIFRKHGNLKKQQALKERLNRSVTMNLDDGEFSVHECAAVLKSFLSELPEPLLTDAYYRAHCQVAQLVKGTMNDEETKLAEEKKRQCLQLLFLLVPETNYRLLKDLMRLLHKVTQHEQSNKMSATNLGTMLAPLILCPRKLSPESLQSNHQMLTRAVAFMIENSTDLFVLPDRLRTDMEMYLKNAKNKMVKPNTPVKSNKPQSPVVNTVFSFVDREKTNKLAAESSTDAALAALYAHVQSMPESAQKKKLVAKLNDANGHGTPGFVRGGGKPKKSGGEGLMKSLLTPKRSTSKQEESKIGRHGSYNLNVHFKTPSKPPSQLLHSFKRQNSESDKEEPQANKVNQKLLSPQSSPAILVSPSEIDSIVKKSAKKNVEQEEQEEQGEDLDGSYIAPKKKAPPPVPERVSSLNRTVEQEDSTSPITNCTKKMSSEMQKSMMTPRSRRPVLAMPSAAQLEKPVVPFEPPPESPCMPPKYNVDEPEVQEEDERLQEEENEEENEEEEEEENDDETTDSEPDRYLASLEDEEDEVDHVPETPGVSTERGIDEIVVKNRVYTSKSLNKEFKTYLESQDIELSMTATPSSMTNDSNLDASVTSSVIGKEAEMLLTGEMQLSESMQAVLNGDDPDDSGATTPSQKPMVKPMVTPSVLEPVDVDSMLALSDITEEDDNTDKENNGSFVSAKSVLSTYSSASTVNCQDIPLPAYGVTAKKEVSTSSITISYPNDGTAAAAVSPEEKKSRKRRSLTEIAELNPISQQRKAQNTQQPRNIFFETDL